MLRTQALDSAAVSHPGPTGPRARKTPTSLLNLLLLAGLACGSSGGGGSGDDDEACLSNCQAPLASMVAVQVDEDEDGTPLPPFTMKFEASSGNNARIEWKFNAQNPGERFRERPRTTYHTFEDDGIFDVALRLTNKRSGRAREIVKTIEVVENLTTDEVKSDMDGFRSDPVPGSTTVQFYIDSLNITVFNWDFDGDGLFDDATGASPEFSFPSEGTFQIAVEGKRTDTDPESITVRREITVGTESDELEAAFTFDVVAGEAPAPLGSDAITGTPGMRIRFRDDSTGSPREYSWDFGAGCTAPTDCRSSAKNPPEVVYDTPGYYWVTLKVDDEDGNSSSYSKLVAATFPSSGVRYEMVWSSSTGIGEGLGSNSVVAQNGDELVADLHLQIAEGTSVNRIRAVLSNYVGGNFMLEVVDTEEFELVKPSDCNARCENEFGEELEDSPSDVVVAGFINNDSGIGLFDLEARPGSSGRAGPDVVRIGRVRVRVLDVDSEPGLTYANYNAMFPGGFAVTRADDETGEIPNPVLAPVCVFATMPSGTSTDPRCAVPSTP